MRYFFLISILLVSGILFMQFSRDQDQRPAIFESSLSGLVSQTFSGGISRIDSVVDLISPRTAFYFSFPREVALAQTGIVIIWHTDSGDIRRTLDLDGLDMHGIDMRIFSIPWITTGKSTVSYSIISSQPLDTGTLSMITSNSEQASENGLPETHASTQIISRSEWGADESYRYADSPSQKKAFQEYLHYRQSPKTQAQLDAMSQSDQRRGEVEKLFPDTRKTLALSRNEGDHRLVWPIEKTEAVDRIIIHHTAENIEAIEASDEVYLRDIYKYHAITRGWGDIGYNYIIGQRGALYEGRAGGEYVVGGHTPGNNEGSVGIAIIGNFENIHLNRDQRGGLEEAIRLMADRYGITLTSQLLALNSCKYSLDCTHLETHPVIALAGHRDYNPTACPGVNIYGELTGLIAKIDTQRTLRKNTEIPHIDPFSADEVMNMELNPSESGGSPAISVMSTLIPKSPKSTKSPIVKIKLSYSGSTILLKGATVSPPIAKLGQKRIPTNQGYQANIHLNGKNQIVIQSGNRTYTGASFSIEGEVVQIDSWVRVPAWDTSRRYNDNLFRGKIIVRNNGGKLLVVNELPIEDYLKGLGEVSNSDLREKIKTIIVSARSYAYYYMDKSHRKYGTLLYDGLDDPDSFQKYLGYGYEMRSPNVSRYAEETTGMIVKYNKEPIKVWYSSSTDGRTFSYLEYCKNSGSMNCMDIPYLQSVEDPGSVGKVRNGHGVGISGLGATYFATQGWDYQKIIQYYMKGVEISKK